MDARDTDYFWDYMETLDEYGELASEYEGLASEHERIVAEHERDRKRAKGLERMLKDKDDENEKLRELVRRLLECIKQGKEEFGYEHGWSCVGCRYYYACDGWDQLWESAAGLGIGDGRRP